MDQSRAWLDRQRAAHPAGRLELYLPAGHNVKVFEIISMCRAKYGQRAVPVRAGALL